MKKIIQKLVIFHAVLMSGALVGIGIVAMVLFGIIYLIFPRTWIMTCSQIGAVIFAANVTYAILAGLIYSLIHLIKMFNHWIKSKKK